MDPMFTTRPYFRSAIPGTIALHSTVGARRFTAMTASQSGRLSSPTSFQSTQGPPWLSYPYVLVKLSPTGRPTERELTDLPSIDLNASYRENGGDWSAVMKDTSLGKMRYDKAANVVWITSKSDVASIGEVSGISGIIPTEKGFVELHAYAKTADFGEHFPVFEKIITGARVAPELQYRPSWTDALPGPVSRFDFKLLGFLLAIGVLIGAFVTIYRRRRT